LIWGLLGWLNYESTLRIINGVKDIDANIMLITSFVGLFCNIVNYTALNANCGALEEQ
jgi:Co/Zn/Cd efflux system component